MGYFHFYILFLCYQLFNYLSLYIFIVLFIICLLPVTFMAVNLHKISISNLIIYLCQQINFFPTLISVTNRC